MRTRWKAIGGNRRYTVQPYLEGLSLLAWMRTLEAAHVNLADLNLDPRQSFETGADVSDSDLNTYLQAYYLPASQRPAGDRNMVERFESDVIAPNRLTPSQRDATLLDFLDRLERLKAAGEIKGDIKFVVHQRQWFRPGKSPRLTALRDERRQLFIEDFAGLINAARERCLDHWLAGIRLGENFNNNMDEFLPLLVQLARGINERTDGWLRSKLFLSNGGNMGADFSGVSTVRQDSSGADFDFLASMSQETGSFAFAYKWMRFLSRDDHYIRTDMAQTQCGGDHICDPEAVADWRTYLGDKLGFDELMKYFEDNQNKYPRHANIVFTGDSSDSLALLVKRGADGELIATPPLRAIRELWQGRGCRGRLGHEFMNGFASDETLPNRKLREHPDAGFALAYVRNGTIQPLAKSDRLWRQWDNICR